MENLPEFKAGLREAADHLRAIPKHTSSDYFMPVPGIISLLHATNRFEAVAEPYGRRPADKLVKQLNDHRRAAEEQLKHAAYYHRHIAWLPAPFPKAGMQPMPGMVKAFTRKEIGSADWSLTPGRCVGVAPAGVNEDFGFEQAITKIHTGLAELNAEIDALPGKIQDNFADLGI